MIQDYVLNHFQGEITPQLADPFQTRWVEGTPEAKSPHESFFTEFGFKSQKAGKAISIGTFRCHCCGFLESYARDEFAVA